MKKWKKMLAILFSLVLLISTITACGSKGGAEDADKEAGESVEGDYSDVRIGVILPSGRGDLSIGDATYNAVATAQERCGFEFDYAEVVNPSDPENFIREFAESGDYDLIIASTFTCFDGMMAVVPEFPDQKFLGWDMSGVPGDNIAFGAFKHQETTFVAGAFAALMDPYGKATINGEEYTWDPNGKIGCIVANNNPIEDAIQVGFEAGARYVNPDIEFSCAYTGSYSDQAKAKELALSLYDGGYNWQMMGAGGACYGQVEGAAELGDGHWAIGFDQDNNGVDVHVIASALNDTTEAMASWIEDFVVNGTFEGQKTSLYGYTTGNQQLKYQEGLEVPAEVQEKLDKIVELVSSGELVPPASFEELETFDEVFSE